MFKIEVTIEGETHGHYWMNKHADDFIQFLPKQFSAMYGVLVKPEDIKVYKCPEEMKAITDSVFSVDKYNEFDFNEAGKIKVVRKMKARFKVGDVVSKEEYESEAEDRERKRRKSKKKAVRRKKVNRPNFKKKKKMRGEVEVDVEEVTIEEADELAQDEETVELEVTGTKLKQWPYDKNGRFLGNE